MARRLTFIIGLMLVLFSSAGVARAGSWAQGSVSNTAGARNYKLWIPERYDNRTPLPLVLMLHGCTQTPEGFAAGTRMNEIADANKFLVAYPEQPASANPYKCWNWFDPAHQSRDAGEPSLLAAIVSDVRATHKVDELRVYAAGVSAGGAMASIMAAAYPEIFSAIAVCSGLEYKAASNVAEALATTKHGGRDPNQQGTQAYQAILAAHKEDGQNAPTSRARHRFIRVIVFQGALDAAVSPVNADQVIGQWAQTNDLLDDARDNNSVNDIADSTNVGTVPNGGHNFTRYVYNDAAGKPLLEKWIVQDMRHAWSGGSLAGSYTDPKGPNASAEIWRFFRQTPRTPPILNAGRKR